MVDRMMDEMMMSNPVEFLTLVNQVPREPRIRMERDRENGHVRLWNDYFADAPMFPAKLFRRRFRMRKHVFLRIVNVLSARNEFFQQRPDATRRLGASALQNALQPCAYWHMARR